MRGDVREWGGGELTCCEQISTINKATNPCLWERTMQAANSSRTRPSTEKDIQPQQPLTEGEFWLAFLMQLSQLLLIFHKAVIHVNKMSAHFYHPRLTTCPGKMGEQAICWLKLQYYTNVPTFISWLTSERGLADHCLPRPLPSSHNHRTRPLPDSSINRHLSVHKLLQPQRSQHWSYSCLHPVTVACGHLTVRPPPFLICTDAGASWQRFSFSFSHALGVLGSSVPRESL